ncbi:hypothetical protein PRIPAC_70877 [Pristionchus pacificus]|uniref:G protein-coupled receptor n=1 Tax=Pristionchus pacificus TaxID=54126 RepID=A0A2A6BZE8_PRIPA|nr:hypothetical protein PRIPAC_70877 [Pristionchus pacificus]|eukprot:PDM71268.1 G protein-coupled receptor [Pristionchus pacificus]
MEQRLELEQERPAIGQQIHRFGVLKGAYFDMLPHFAHRSLVGSRRLNLTILPLVYFLPLIDRSLPPEGGERAGGIERAQTVGRGQGGETQVNQEIGNQHRLIFSAVACGKRLKFGILNPLANAVRSIPVATPARASIKTCDFKRAQKSKKISFRRDVVWSQRMISVLDLARFLRKRPHIKLSRNTNHAFWIYSSRGNYICYFTTPLDYLTLTFDSASGIAGLILNTVFIYLLLYRTSRHLNSYSVLLLNACITDTLASLCVLYTINRQIPVTHTSGLGIYLGPCSVVSVCVLCYVPTFIYVATLTTFFFVHGGYEVSRKVLIATVIIETRPDLIDLHWSWSQSFLRPIAPSTCTVFPITEVARVPISNRPNSNPCHISKNTFTTQEFARLIAALLPKQTHSTSPVLSVYLDCVMYILDFITIISQSTLGTCGVLLNMLFIYLVIFRSSKQLHAYSVLLLDMCINDMVASTCALYSISRQIPIGASGGLGVALGPCRFVSSLSCSIAFTIWMHCYANCLVVLILCFVFRLYVLKRSTPTRAQTTIVCIFSYLPTFLYVVILIHGQLESDNYSEHLKQLHELVIKTRPELFEPYVDLEGRSDKHSFTGILSIFYVIMLGPITMIVCLVVRFQIQRILHRFESMSAATKRMNVQLLRALTTQNLVEFFMLVLLLIFFLSFGGGYLTAPFIEHLVFILGSIIPVSNPIINLVCITHYKQEAKKLIFSRIEHIGEIDKKASTTTF